MKKPNFPFLTLMALLLAGCASSPPPKFDGDPFASGGVGNSSPPPPASLFSTLPPSNGAQPVTPKTTAATPQDPVKVAAAAPVTGAPAPAAVMAAPAPAKSDLLNPPTDMFVLGPGDQLDIETLGNSPYHATLTVGLDGKIYYSFLPGIDVWGLTLAQAKARIEEELSKYLTQPQVLVTLRAVGSKFIWVLGRVAKPGIYAVSGSMTLLEALSTAGGTASSSGNANTTQDLADLRHSFVMREGKLLPVDFVRLLEKGDMSQNIYLKPDDFVYIPSALAQQIYILGAVVAPHSIPYTENMNIISALASGGGLVKNAYSSHIGIVRGSLSQPKLITVDYGNIVRGRAPNVPLEPGDIVYVPLTPYHVLSDYADLIVTTFVRAWTANMGVRAVQGSTAVSVSVPVGATVAH